MTEARQFEHQFVAWMMTYKTAWTLSLFHSDVSVMMLDVSWVCDRAKKVLSRSAGEEGPTRGKK